MCSVTQNGMCSCLISPLPLVGEVSFQGFLVIWGLFIQEKSDQRSESTDESSSTNGHSVRRIFTLIVIKGMISKIKIYVNLIG